MKDVRITVLKRTCYSDLIEKYENPLENPCEMKIGSIYISLGGKKPDGFCENAWRCIKPYAISLANGGSDFFDGWMKNTYSAMVSCDDGFRPVTFYVEAI